MNSHVFIRFIQWKLQNKNFVKFSDKLQDTAWWHDTGRTIVKVRLPKVVKLEAIKTFGK